LRQILVGFVLVFGVFAGIVLTLDSCHKKQAQQGEVQVAIHQGAAEVHQVQAQESDKKDEVLKKQLKVSQANVDKLKAELEALKLKVPESPADNSEILAVVAKQEEVIGAQDKQIAGLNKSIVVLTKSRDEWKLTAEERLKQAQAQAVVTEAWKSAVTTSTNKGRLQGFAIGVALGFFGGRK